MKKFCLTVSLLGMVLPVLGAASQMAMVSYFPIPYVTYQNVYVHKQLDVGLGSQCDWNVGNANLSSVPITATTLNLYGTLNLQNISTLNTTGTSTVTLGMDPSGTEDIKLSFSNLRVETSDRFLNINATDVLELTSGNTSGLLVYPDVIKEPGKIMSGCEGGVSWQRITEKDGKDGVYLVCGDVISSSCSPSHGGQTTYTEECPSTSMEGIITWTWIPEKCSYHKDSTCRTVYQWVETIQTSEIRECGNPAAFNFMRIFNDDSCFNYTLYDQGLCSPGHTTITVSADCKPNGSNCTAYLQGLLNYYHGILPGLPPGGDPPYECDANHVGEFYGNGLWALPTVPEGYVVRLKHISGTMHMTNGVPPYILSVENNFCATTEVSYYGVRCEKVL